MVPKVEGHVTDTLDRVIYEPKTLMFYGSGLVSEDPETRRKLTLTQELVLDYYHTSIGGLALQKDSEFLQLFNHYTLKAKETGCYYQIHRRKHMDRYMRESFEMQGCNSIEISVDPESGPEPDPRHVWSFYKCLN